MRPRFYMTLGLFVYGVTAMAQDFVFDSIGVQSMTIGVVTQKADTWVIRVERPGGYDDFWPVNLPAQFAIAGQEVVFEGARGRIPVNVRLVGTPVKLNLIRVLYRTQPKDDNGEIISTEKEQVSMTDSSGYLENNSGKVLLISDVVVIEVAKGDEIKRFVPETFPDDFKTDGATITFSAIILKHDPNVRMMGVPVRITNMMMEETMAIDTGSLQESIKPFFPFDSVGYLKETEGTIRLIGDVFVIEVALENGITRYLPVMLPESFRKEGLHIHFSGTLGNIPPNVRMVGTPITPDMLRE